mgnify:FL=1
MVVIDNINNLDLDNTICCGQIFRYEKLEDDSYIVILKDRVVKLKYIDNKLYVESNNMDNIENVIREYLDLDRDYISIIENIKERDDVLGKYLDKSIGLKMIKQDPIECIVSYIISQNNSVRNIKNSLDLISYKFGDKVMFLDKEYYLFPSIDKLSKISLDEFRECKVGFRDRYLVDIISDIVENRLNVNYIFEMNSEDSLRYLMSFRGIGMKVASCILLFAYQKYDVYPIDTWVKKYMDTNYGIKDEKKIKEFCKEKYGKYSGLAIQYMFNGMRNM